MSVPTYDQFIEPILRHLVAHPDGASARDVHEAAAASLGLTESDRQQLVPSGVQPVYKNRAGWAHDRLKRSGYSTSPRRGFWKVSPDGIEFAGKHPAPLPSDIVETLAQTNVDVRLRPLAVGLSSDQQDPPGVTAIAVTASPDDRLDSALAELRTTVAAELLEVLGQASPKFFEAIVLDLLHKMGYGASRRDLQRVGGAGDGVSTASSRWISLV